MKVNQDAILDGFARWAQTPRRIAAVVDGELVEDATPSALLTEVAARLGYNLCWAERPRECDHLVEVGCVGTSVNTGLTFGAAVEVTASVEQARDRAAVLALLELEDCEIDRMWLVGEDRGRTDRVDGRSLVVVCTLPDRAGVVICRNASTAAEVAEQVFEGRGTDEERGWLTGLLENYGDDEDEQARLMMMDREGVLMGHQILVIRADAAVATERNTVGFGVNEKWEHLAATIAGEAVIAVDARRRYLSYERTLMERGIEDWDVL